MGQSRSLSAPAGTRLHGVGEEGILFSNIAEAIARRFNLPLKSISQKSVNKQFGFLSSFVSFDNPVSNTKTQQLLNWNPKGIALVSDIESGSVAKFVDKPNLG